MSKNIQCGAELTCEACANMGSKDPHWRKIGVRKEEILFCPNMWRGSLHDNFYHHPFLIKCSAIPVNSEHFFVLQQQNNLHSFPESKPNDKFQSPRTTPSGRKVLGGERTRERVNSGHNILPAMPKITVFGITKLQYTVAVFHNVMRMEGGVLVKY